VIVVLALFGEIYPAFRYLALRATSGLVLMPALRINMRGSQMAQWDSKSQKSNDIANKALRDCSLEACSYWEGTLDLLVSAGSKPAAHYECVPMENYGLG
jgi:hypothetical protein